MVFHELKEFQKNMASVEKLKILGKGSLVKDEVMDGDPCEKKVCVCVSYYGAPERSIDGRTD